MHILDTDLNNSHLMSYYNCACRVSFQNFKCYMCFLNTALIIYKHIFFVWLQIQNWSSLHYINVLTLFLFKITNATWFEYHPETITYVHVYCVLFWPWLLVFWATNQFILLLNVKAYCFITHTNPWTKSLSKARLFSEIYALSCW